MTVSGAATREEAKATSKPPGYLVLPTSNEVIDMSRLLGSGVQSSDDALARIQVSTITGGVPDASDPLPEGTIIIVVTAE